MFYEFFTVRQNCSPQPATHGSLRALFAQLKGEIDNTWRENEIYEYSNGNIRVSQTECDKNINGLFYYYYFCCCCCCL
jgi:hypothetical protein